MRSRSIQSIHTELAKLYSKKVISRTVCPANLWGGSSVGAENLTPINAESESTCFKTRRPPEEFLRVHGDGVLDFCVEKTLRRTSSEAFLPACYQSRSAVGREDCSCIRAQLPRFFGLRAARCKIFCFPRRVGKAAQRGFHALINILRTASRQRLRDSERSGGALVRDNFFT